MSKLVPCKICGHEIAKSSKKCPNCGKRRKMMEYNPVGGVLLITLCIVLLFFTFVTSSGSEEPTDTSLESANITSAAATPTPEPTFEPIVLNVSNWEVTITDFYFADGVEITWLTEYQSDENAQFAIVQMTAKNLGKEADIFLPWISYGSDVNIKLKCNGYTFTRSELLLSNDDLTSETLNPLVSASGIVAFNMPTELIDSDAEIEIVISSDWQNTSAPLR